ncbi:MAG: hypothetical protein KGL39_20360 [Patescibacteria group bacterium]|nr:hypothetical protein [Patescibacteria group bacterium]
MAENDRASPGEGRGMSFRNSDYIRSQDPRLYEALSDLDQQGGVLEQQVNGNRTGQPLPPPAIDGVTVTGQNGHFHVQIQHSAQIYRGIQYYAEFADNPGFTSPHTIHMGDSREHTQFLGNGTYYWRAYAAYSSSGPGAPAYHGGAANPQPVSGGGSIGGPKLLAPQGSGTGSAGEGLSGPGPIPFRSSTGVPPVRGQAVGGGAAAGGGSPGGSLAPSPATGLPAGMSSTIAGGGGGGGTSATAVIFDVYANWTTAKYDPTQQPVNTQIVITDRNFIVYVVQKVSGTNKWVYEAGTYSVVQSAIAGLKGFNGAALGTTDSGLLINVTDYAHVLKWGGAAWGWGPGELGSGYLQDFAAAPTGNGWHLCDGTAGVSYLKADGTLGTATLPNTTSSPAYRKNGSAYTNTITAAGAPTVTVPGASAASAGTGNVNNGTGSAVSVLEPPFSGGGGGGGSNIPVTLNGDPIANYEAITYFRQ